MTLKQWRKKKKMTRKELAKITGTTETYICLIENGKRNPSDTMKLKLAKAFDTKIINIFFAIQETKCYIKEKGGIKNAYMHKSE